MVNQGIPRQGPGKGIPHFRQLSHKSLFRTDYLHSPGRCPSVQAKLEALRRRDFRSPRWILPFPNPDSNSIHLVLWTGHNIKCGDQFRPGQGKTYRRTVIPLRCQGALQQVLMTARRATQRRFRFRRTGALPEGRGMTFKDFTKPLNLHSPDLCLGHGGTRSRNRKRTGKKNQKQSRHGPTGARQGRYPYWVLHSTIIPYTGSPG
ncbi:MAG: hypothetical protein BWX80_03917 [Candidatus Hydrogenedentes bacterium ADurb.Bin101]|nr:MAG: hypothetical protein BWX80_03917 [Candidatus Hydrogenedentes bacterium ADurb.Bin101]